MKKYDYLIVGAGLFGSTFAYEASKRGKKCLVIDKRDHIGGNVYCEKINGINVHKYGAHIFHTNSKEIWEYVNQFCEFNNFILNVVANYKNEVYNLPFNMNTFCKLWNITKPEEAKKIIDEQRKILNGREPGNYEEQAISLVGTDIYNKLIKGYTEKQWGRDCKDLPSFIIKRLPVRYTFDNNYYYDRYQGIPIGGYNQIFEKMLSNCDIKLSCDFFKERESLEEFADKIIFTGMIDEYFDYQYGELEYRSLKFENEILENVDNFQGTAAMSFTDRDVLFTRIIEHKHFEFLNCAGTVITREYSKAWSKGEDAYYPINDDKNSKLYLNYSKLAKQQPNIIFGGRLGHYKYYDMDKTIEAALELVKVEFNND
jgi:UDP-galactopyranose mutase